MGKKYDDNAKYLFEYVNKVHKDVRCIWLTRNKKVMYQIRALGYEAYYANSIKGLWSEMRCGVAFMTNGLEDFSRIPLVGGSKIVALWHGVGGFKKIYNENYFGIKLKIKQAVDFFFNWAYRDISLGTSEYTAERIMEQFNVERESIVITGQPRNDLFCSSISRKDLLCNVSLEGFSKVVLYMPTYRVSPNTHKDEVKEILENLMKRKDFIEFLKTKNILFMVKLHPLTQFKMEVPSVNVKILADGEISSVQHLLMVADCLVTDYSSCSVDYALLCRPIVFYVPDEDDYISYSSLNDAYKRLVKEKAKTIDELMDGIVKGCISQTEAINDMFEDKAILGTCYSENMYQAICRKCGIKN